MTTTTPRRIVFMGTPDFAVPTLQALILSPHEVVAVYSQPPRPAGRGHQLTPSPVQALAESHGIAVHTPTSLKDEVIQAQFRCHQADVAVVAAYGLLLPKPILEAYPHGCINVHPSDLPRWRGAAPIQRTLMAGDTATAMCIMQMDEGLDTGDVVWRQAVTIEPRTTAGMLHDAMAALGAQAILEVLDSLDHLTAAKQSTDGVTYAKKIDKAAARIDWSQSAEQIYHQIYGLNPYPAATTQLHGETIKIYAAEIVKGSGAAGTTLDGALTIACGTGALKLLELQRPNKNRMDAASLLRGFDVPAGTILS